MDKGERGLRLLCKKHPLRRTLNVQAWDAGSFLAGHSNPVCPPQAFSQAKAEEGPCSSRSTNFSSDSIFKGTHNREDPAQISHPLNAYGQYQPGLFTDRGRSIGEEMAHEAVVNDSEPSQPNLGYNEADAARSVRPKGKKCRHTKTHIRNELPK